MKTPSYGTLEEVKNALLNYEDIKAAETFKFTLLDNSSYLYTSLDVNLPIKSTVAKAHELLIKRGPIRQGLGMQVDALELTVFPTTATIGGVGWLQALRNGALDGAKVKVERFIFRHWGSGGLVGAVDVFNGFVSDIDPIGRTSAMIRVTSVADLLFVEWPRMVYAAQCVWRLYDGGCALSRVSFTNSSNVTGNGTVNSFSTDLAQANNYFDRGVLRFTAGNNIDVLRTVKTHSAGNISVAYPLPSVPSANDTLNIYPGCDRTRTTCITKFNNGNFFRGFPFIPSPESGI